MYSDTFFKGHFIAAESRSYRGLKLGRSRIVPDRTNPPRAGSTAATSTPRLWPRSPPAPIATASAYGEFRPDTAWEWARFWPMSHNTDAAQFHAGRRLYRAYEPFLDARMIAASAVIPQAWKLDLRLFQRMAKPLLRKTALIPHSYGYFPYLGGLANVPA